MHHTLHFSQTQPVAGDAPQHALSHTAQHPSFIHRQMLLYAMLYHLPYVVCMEDEGMHCVIEHGVKRHLPYVVCVKNGGCGA